MPPAAPPQPVAHHPVRPRPVPCPSAPPAVPVADVAAPAAPTCWLVARVLGSPADLRTHTPHPVVLPPYSTIADDRSANRTSPIRGCAPPAAPLRPHNISCCQTSLLACSCSPDVLPDRPAQRRSAGHALSRLPADLQHIDLPVSARLPLRHRASLPPAEHGCLWLCAHHLFWCCSACFELSSSDDEFMIVLV
eukprot:162928-Prymnesium_polylepis.1